MTPHFDDAVTALYPTLSNSVDFLTFQSVASDLRHAVARDLDRTSGPYAFWSLTTEIGPAFLSFSEERICRSKRRALYVLGASEFPVVARWTEEPTT